MTALAESTDPVSMIKAEKVMMKNWRFGLGYKARARYPGRLTVYAATSNRRAPEWQRFASRPVDIRRVAAVGTNGRNVHMSFIDPPNVDLFADDFRDLLNSEPATAAERHAAAAH